MCIRDSRKALNHRTPTVGVNTKTAPSPLILRVPLLKFPSVIGHSTSRINRLINEDTYSVNILKLPTRFQELSRNHEPLLKKSILNISIFDGHGGKGRVSQLLASSLHREITNTEAPTKEQFFHLLDSYEQLIGGPYWRNVNAHRETFWDRFIENCNTKQEQVLFDSDHPQHSGPRMIFDMYGNIIDKTSLLNFHERLRIYYAYMKFDLERCCGFAQESGESLTFEERIKKYSGGSTASSIFLSSYDESLAMDESFFMNPQGLLKLVVTQVGDSKIILRCV